MPLRSKKRAKSTCRGANDDWRRRLARPILANRSGRAYALNARGQLPGLQDLRTTGAVVATAANGGLGEGVFVRGGGVVPGRLDDSVGRGRGGTFNAADGGGFGREADMTRQAQQRDCFAAAEAEAAEDGAEDQAEVEQQPGGFDVLAVEDDLAADAVEVCVGRQVDLGQAGDAGLDGQAVEVTGDLLAQDTNELRPLGARADERHVAPKNVVELRQLVEVKLAEPVAQARDARVAVDAGPNRAGAGFGIDPHGAELIHGEDATAAADASLLVNTGPFGAEADEDDQDADHRQPWDKEYRGQRAIDGAFNEVVAGFRAGFDQGVSLVNAGSFDHGVDG